MSIGNAALIEEEPEAVRVVERPAEAPRTKKITRRKKATRKLWPALQWEGYALPLALLLLWDITARFGWVKPIFLPSPWSVIWTFWDLLFHDRLLADFETSAVVVLEGFSLGTVVGLGTGIATGLSKTVEKILGPTLNRIRQVPPLAWLPLIILWVGAGNVGKVVVVSKVVFFPVFLNTLQGIRGVSKEYIEVGRIFGYTPAQLTRRIILPAALPSIFVGVRYGAGMAWAMLIAAEMLSGQYGLGFLLARAQELLLTKQLFVVIVIIGLVGFAVDYALRMLEARLLRWKQGFEG
jgi:sulfonate transport system permease protein